jgi:regulator of sirC expression with transglutaminase-like and TPR domain
VDTTESARLRGLAADFAARAGGADAAVDLADCALRVGRIADLALDLAGAAAQLDAVARDAEPAVRDASPGRRADALAAFLFNDLGFRGNADDYYDPQNSYLHRVIERRQGLPITLSILLIEVARRLGVTVEGVGAPQHFLVRVAAGAAADGAWRYLDPFHGGREVDQNALREDMAQRLAAGGRAGPPGADPTELFLSAVTKRQILTRVLQNLKLAGARRRDFATAMGAAEHLVALTPWALDEIRDRGMVAAQLGLSDAALHDLRTYQEQMPDAPDAAQVDHVVRRLEHDTPSDRPR